MKYAVWVKEVSWHKFLADAETVQEAAAMVCKGECEDTEEYNYDHPADHIEEWQIEKEESGA